MVAVVGGMVLSLAEEASLGFQHDLPEGGALFNQLVTLSGIFQGNDTIDDRLELPAKHAFHDVQKVALAAHGGSHHLDLAEENLAEIRLRGKTRRRATCEHSAAAASGAQALYPSVCANVIDDDVDATLTGEIADLLIEFFLCVIDQEIGAQRARAFQLLVCAGGRVHAASHHFRDLNCGSAYTCARSENQDVFSRTDVSFADHHAPRRHENERRRRRLLECQRIGNRQHDMRGDRDELGVRTVANLAENPERSALTAEACGAEFAAAATDSGIDCHALPCG